MQMTVEPPAEGDDEKATHVVTICRDPNDADWYFSHGVTDADVGLIAPAQPDSDGYRVSFTFSSGGTAQYDVTGDGVDITQDGLETVQLDLAEAVCVEEGVPVSFDMGSVPPCSPESLRPWSP